MKKKLLLSVLVLSVFFCKAQNINWAKQIINYGNPLTQLVSYDHNGNVYIAQGFNDSVKVGTTVYTALNGFYHYGSFFAKFDTTGTLLWSTDLPNSGPSCMLIMNDITCDNAGNVYFIGQAYDTIKFGAVQVNNAHQMIYGKFNNTGVCQWMKTCTSGYAVGERIIADNSGNVYIAGDKFLSNPLEFDGGIISLYPSDMSGYGDIFVVKLDNSGNAIWGKSGGATNTGGNLDGDICKGLAVDKFGNVYLSGLYAGATAYFDGIPLICSGGNDICIIKYDAAGNIIWAKKVGTTIDDNVEDMAMDANDNFYLTGAFTAPTSFPPLAAITNSGGGQPDMYIVKFDTAGVAKWVKKGGGTGYDAGNSISILKNQIVAVGYIDANSTFSGISLTVANGNAFVAKYDLQGNILWAKNYAPAGSCWATSVTSDDVNSIYCTGQFSATTTFGSTTLTATGYSVNTVVFQIADCPTISLSPATSNLNICASTSTTLSAPAGFSPYLWSTGATTQTISVSAPGIYSADVTYPGGCKASSNQINVANFQAPPPPSICLVTVDIASTHNILDWSKDTLATNIDSFRIYREVTTNVYAQIGAVSFDSLSEFHDYGADPNVTSYKYKISILDSCGNETAQSLYHNTIHLQNLGGGNLQWTLYGIESSANPVVFYRVLRDDLGTNNFLPISSTIPGGNSTYTDVNYASFPNADYRVDVTWNISCTPLRATINTTRSNIKHQNSIVSGLSFSELNSAVSMYPNPANTFVTIVLSEDIQKANVEILNVLGEVIYKDKISTTTGTSLVKQIDISRYAKGIYSVTIESNGTKVFKKLVVN